MKKALLISDRINDVYAPDTQRQIAEQVDVYAPPLDAQAVAADHTVLSGLQVLMTTWNGPVLDEAFMRAAPELEAVFFAAGSVRPIVTDAFWERGAVICSAWEANAIPVAEFTLSQILFGLKQGLQTAIHYRTQRKRSYLHQQIQGAFGGKVGIISLGMIGRRVIDHLKHFDIQVLAYDPYVGEAEAERLGVDLVSLDELFQSCQVVSLHAPWLEATEDMIRGRHFGLMQPNATFINTARGAVVHEVEMIEALTRRPDLCAMLDVTRAEPLEQDSPLWEMPNVLLTPHVAGSVGQECFRMGHFMFEELQRHLSSQPLKWRLTQQQVASMA